MHQALQDLFDEGKQPTHCCSREVNDLALPILTLVTTAQQQVAVYRQRLMQAKLAEHDGQYAGQIERLKQRLAVLDAALPDFLRMGERIADSFTEWSRLIAETEEQVVAAEDRAEAARQATFRAEVTQ